MYVVLTSASFFSSSFSLSDSLPSSMSTEPRFNLRNTHFVLDQQDHAMRDTYQLLDVNKINSSDLDQSVTEIRLGR